MKDIAELIGTFATLIVAVMLLDRVSAAALPVNANEKPVRYEGGARGKLI